MKRHLTGRLLVLLVVLFGESATADARNVRVIFPEKGAALFLQSFEVRFAVSPALGERSVEVRLDGRLMGEVLAREGRFVLAMVPEGPHAIEVAIIPVPGKEAGAEDRDEVQFVVRRRAVGDLQHKNQQRVETRWNALRRALERTDLERVHVEAGGILRETGEMRRFRLHHPADMTAYRRAVDEFKAHLRRIEKAARAGRLEEVRTAAARTGTLCADCHRRFVELSKSMLKKGELVPETVIPAKAGIQK